MMYFLLYRAENPEECSKTSTSKLEDLLETPYAKLAKQFSLYPRKSICNSLLIHYFAKAD